MKRFLASLLLAVAVCLAATDSADAGRKYYYYASPAYYAAPAYYVAPPAYYAPPVVVVPAPVVVRRSIFGHYRYYRAPVYAYPAPAVVHHPAYYPAPVYFGHRRPRKLEIEYKWTRHGLRVKYDYDD